MLVAWFMTQLVGWQFLNWMPTGSVLVRDDPGLMVLDSGAYL